MSSIHPVLHFWKGLEPAIYDLLRLIFADVPIFGEAILGLAIEQREVQGLGLGQATPGTVPRTVRGAPLVEPAAVFP